MSRGWFESITIRIMENDMTTPVIIPWVADQNTKYSTSDYFANLIQNDPAVRLVCYIDYVLWECSTEFMVSHGLPTNADVKQWILWLEGRIDKDDADIQSAVLSCREYIKE